MTIGRTINRATTVSRTITAAFVPADSPNSRTRMCCCGADAPDTECCAFRVPVVRFRGATAGIGISFRAAPLNSVGVSLHRLRTFGCGGFSTAVERSLRCFFRAFVEKSCTAGICAPPGRRFFENFGAEWVVMRRQLESRMCVEAFEAFRI